MIVSWDTAGTTLRLVIINGNKVALYSNEGIQQTNSSREDLVALLNDNYYKTTKTLKDFTND